jgi:hypothetical protein
MQHAVLLADWPRRSWRKHDAMSSTEHTLQATTILACSDYVIMIEVPLRQPADNQQPPAHAE